MNENDIKNLRDLQFTITENMKNITPLFIKTSQVGLNKLVSSS